MRERIGLGEVLIGLRNVKKSEVLTWVLDAELDAGDAVGFTEVLDVSPRAITSPFQKINTRLTWSPLNRRAGFYRMWGRADLGAT